MNEAARSESVPAAALAAEPRADAILHGLYYYGLPSRALKPGRLVAKTLFNQPLLFGRGRDGTAFALLDICPHRGIPLRYGRFDGREVECAYHGWRFDGAGRCTAIPSLVEGQRFDLARIKVRRFAVREAQGCVWVLNGHDEAGAPPPPTLPDIGDASPRLVERMLFPVPVDHAVIGLMDPAHGPFVHRSWWWRKPRSIHAKAKQFGPTELGFAMLRHAPSRNTGGYRLLGGDVSTEITFHLPGVRVEHIRAGRHTVIGLTAVTPIDARTTEIYHSIYWTVPWLSALSPVVRRFARLFLGQDRDAVVKQQEGLRSDPSLMLIDDADRQAKWYYRLKLEWQRAQAEGRAFINPVRETTLRWRS